MNITHQIIHSRINDLLSQGFKKKDIVIYLTPETLESMYSPSIDARSIYTYEFAGVIGYLGPLNSIGIKL